MKQDEDRLGIGFHLSIGVPALVNADGDVKATRRGGGGERETEEPTPVSCIENHQSASLDLRSGCIWNGSSGSLAYNIIKNNLLLGASALV